MGDAPLKLFLRLVATKESGEIIFKKNDCRVDFYSRVLAGDYNITIREDFELEKSVGKLNSDNSKGRIDIWSALELTVKDEDGKDSSLAVGMLIENKIYSNEGKNQTVRYFEAVNSYMNEFPSEMEYSSGMGILLTATKHPSWYSMHPSLRLFPITEPPLKSLQGLSRSIIWSLLWDLISFRPNTSISPRILTRSSKCLTVTDRKSFGCVSMTESTFPI